MAVETIPYQLTIKQAFDTPVYAADGSALSFGSLFTNTRPSQARILVIFIRHFFCGNCQEYVRRLSSVDSPFHPSHKSNINNVSTTTTNFSKPATRTLPEVVIIGPGLPTLISTYVNLTKCSYPVFADPSTTLYDLLGMHRTFSLGHKAPIYIQQSLISGAVKSAVQIVKRVGNGDALGGGDWNVNGGEFLFVRPSVEQSATSRFRARSTSRSKTDPPGVPSTVPMSSTLTNITSGWKLAWCHRMHNSRDHTELNDLHYNTCFPLSNSTTSSLPSDIQATSPPRSILINANRPPQPVKSHTFPIMSNSMVMKSCGYSTECDLACPGPDIPKSREEVQAQRQRSQSPAVRSTKRNRSRSTSTGASTLDSLECNTTPPKSQSFKTRSSTHRHQGSGGSSTTDTSVESDSAQPRKSFSGMMGRVGGLVRSKSMSGNSKPSFNPLNSKDKRDNHHNSSEDNDLIRRPSTSISTSQPKRSFSISRSKPTFRSNNTNNNTITDAVATPSTTNASKHTRPKSRSKSRPHQSSLDNDAIVVDGVEFINVISVQARVDTSKPTPRLPLSNFNPLHQHPPDDSAKVKPAASQHISSQPRLHTLSETRKQASTSTYPATTRATPHSSPKAASKPKTPERTELPSTMATGSSYPSSNTAALKPSSNELTNLSDNFNDNNTRSTLNHTAFEDKQLPQIPRLSPLMPAMATPVSSH